MATDPTGGQGSKPAPGVPMPFIQATHFTPGRDGVKPRLIVLHTMEAPETEGRATQVARWFASGAVEASVHYCVDDKLVVQTLHESDTAWAVGNYPMNQASISIEMAGYASQTPPQWHDPYSLALLRRVARLVVDIAHRNGIPLTKIAPADILAGKAGLCGHLDITNAMHTQGGHTDPGPNFPWADFMQLIVTTHDTTHDTAPAKGTAS